MVFFRFTLVCVNVDTYLCGRKHIIYINYKN